MSEQQELSAILAEMASGDQVAFGHLYDRTAPQIFGLSLRLLGSRRLAEEVLPMIYAQIWREAGGYARTGLEPRQWMRALTRNHCVWHLRRRRSTTVMPVASGDKPHPADLSLPPAGRSTTETGGAAPGLLALPALQAEAIGRAYLNGETYDDLARTLGISVDGLRTQIRAGLLTIWASLS